MWVSCYFFFCFLFLFMLFLFDVFFFFFFSSRRRHTRFDCDWSSDVCSSDLLSRLHGRDRGRVHGLRPSPGGGGDPGGGESVPAHLWQRFLLRELRRAVRSEERRVGKECRSRWSPYH